MKSRMKPLTFHQEGCTVEAVVEDTGNPVMDLVLRIFDPKGKQIVVQRSELLGYTLLEDRLIQMLPESKREDLREVKRFDQATRRKRDLLKAA